ncbi:MAG: DNA repair exonuclease [Planctomycetota bacterium]|nr:DNA repair exonuclease [Planctomycetota bacterium]
MSGRSFTFIHASDLHIDSPLRGLMRYPGTQTERLRGASRAAFANLVSAAIERAVTFMVVAGDVFDGEWKDYNSGLWFTSEVRRLVAAGIPLYLLRGNHDAESRLTKSLSLPEGVFEFSSSAPVTVRVKVADVALHGQSFGVPHVHQNLARDYPAPVADVFNIGVLHTGLEGYEGHGHYAPCTVADLRAKGYDYWALGHIHARQVVDENPWIVFPGNLQGRHARELGPKGATLVHVVDGRVSQLEELHCDVARWAHVEVDLSNIDTEEAALLEMRRGLELALSTVGDRLLAARVTFNGTTRLDAVLRVDLVRIESEVRSRGLALSQDLWIEKVRLETRGLDRAPRREDGFTALAERIAEATLDPDEAGSLARELGRLGDRLPANVTAVLQPKDAATILEAAPRATRYLAALLALKAPAREGASE